MPVGGIKTRVTGELPLGNCFSACRSAETKMISFILKEEAVIRIFEFAFEFAESRGISGPGSPGF